MQTPRNDAPSRPASMTLLGLVSLVARTLATSVEPFLHRRFGSRYFGIHAGCVFPAILIWCCNWRGYDVRPLLLYAGLYAVAVILARAETGRLEAKGEVIHSQYNGWPRLLSLRGFRNLREQTAKAIEPYLMFLIGGVLITWSPPLGSYLMVAGGGLLVSIGLAETCQRVRDRDLQDALIDQRISANRLRAKQVGF